MEWRLRASLVRIPSQGHQISIELRNRQHAAALVALRR